MTMFLRERDWSFKTDRQCQIETGQWLTLLRSLTFVLGVQAYQATQSTEDQVSRASMAHPVQLPRTPTAFGQTAPRSATCQWLPASHSSTDTRLRRHCHPVHPSHLTVPPTCPPEATPLPLCPEGMGAAWRPVELDHRLVGSQSLHPSRTQEEFSFCHSSLGRSSHPHSFCSC